MVRRGAEGADVRETTIARSYAETLFELGERQHAPEAFAAALHEVVALLEHEPRVRLFLESPRIERADKKAALERALATRVPPLFLNFLLVVLDKGRQRLLPEIAVEYDQLRDDALGRVHVQVTLAREVDERGEEDLRADLTRILGRTVIPHVRVNPRILGGFILRYGDRVVDASVRRRLAAMRRRLLEAALPAAALPAAGEL
jgi:F-type H+-transporting ATPase subunit delta